MDGKRIIKLLHNRCIDPLEDEDKDEEDEQLMSPAYSQVTDNLSSSSNPVVTMSSPLQHPISQPQPLDQTDPLLSVPVEMPPFPDLWSDLSTDNNLDIVSSNVMPSTPTANDHEVPMKIIRVHRSLIREDMIEIFLDPSILKFNLNMPSL